MYTVLGVNPATSILDVSSVCLVPLTQQMYVLLFIREMMMVVLEVMSTITSFDTPTYVHMCV